MRMHSTDLSTQLIAKHLVLCLVAAALLVGCDDDEEGGTGNLDDTNTSGTTDGTSGTTDGTTSGDTSGSSGTCYTLSDGKCVEETFQNPPVLAPDENGVHHLSIGPTETTIDGQRHCVRAYNNNFLAPTIETPARVGTDQRQVRVDIANSFKDHDFRSLKGDDTCACKDTAGAECVPAHIHDRCIDPSLSDCTCTNGEGEECEHMFDFNVTNLHAHGSHVRPDFSRGGDACEPYNEGGIAFRCRECGSDVCDGNITDDTCYNGDNVLNAIHPGEGGRYRWDIDEDGTHHTGLQWYHPHIHGTTAIQVVSGAAGAWIVRGELDALDGIKDAKERVMLFSTPSIAGDNGFQPLADGVECTEDTITFNNFSLLGDTAVLQKNIINGQRRPRLVTAPGQVERWRLLNAGFLDEVYLGIFKGADSECTSFDTETPVQLTQIGRDGMILPQTYADDFFFMAPGYRIEGLIGGQDFKDGETYCMVAARFLQETSEDDFGRFGGKPMSLIIPSRDELVARFNSDGDVVAIVNVTADAGPATETELPDFSAVAALAPSLELDGVPIEQRCADAAAVTDAAEIDQVSILQVGFFTADLPDPCGCPDHNLNCYNFETTDRSARPFDRDLILDEVEYWRVASSVDGHPFHIHINPFIVCPEDVIFEPLPFPHWRDTYLVNLGRQVDLVSQNKSFTGPYVLHCHKLTHEDEGMMELIRVCDPATDDTCGDHNWRACAADDLACMQKRAATECAVMAQTPDASLACAVNLGSPTGICGPNACVNNSTCDANEVCGAANLCEPAAPCNPPCGPGSSCVHGVCE